MTPPLALVTREQLLKQWRNLREKLKETERMLKALGESIPRDKAPKAVFSPKRTDSTIGMIRAAVYGMVGKPLTTPSVFTVVAHASQMVVHTDHVSTVLCHLRRKG
jgi:hypothetical protein